jgi:hypothetical protein
MSSVPIYPPYRYVEKWLPQELGDEVQSQVFFNGKEKPGLHMHI